MYRMAFVGILVALIDGMTMPVANRISKSVWTVFVGDINGSIQLPTAYVFKAGNLAREIWSFSQHFGYPHVVGGCSRCGDIAPLVDGDAKHPLVCPRCWHEHII